MPPLHESFNPTARATANASIARAIATRRMSGKCNLSNPHQVAGREYTTATGISKQFIAQFSLPLDGNTCVMLILALFHIMDCDSADRERILLLSIIR
jgi:hypothetical protein